MYLKLLQKHLFVSVKINFEFKYSKPKIEQINIKQYKTNLFNLNSIKIDNK